MGVEWSMTACAHRLTAILGIVRQFTWRVQMYAISIPAGRLTIRPSTKDATSCELWLDDELIGNYGSAGIAAQVICEKRSGCNRIDNLESGLPRSIEDWHWIRVSHEGAQHA